MLIHVHLVLIPLLLFCSAIFAAAEASLFSLSRAQLESLRHTRPTLYRHIKGLIVRPDSLLSTLIISNECVNIMLGTFVATLLEYHGDGMDARLLVFISVLLSSGLLLTFSEILPKIVAFRLPVLTSSVLVYPTLGVHRLLTPLRKVFMWISGSLLRVIGIRVTPPAAVSEKDFLTLVEVGAESGSLNSDEKAMILNVFHFSDLSISSIMTPWNRVFSITDQMKVEEVLDAVRKKTFSRIPVVSARENRVVGILYTKELLKLLLPEQSPSDEVLEKATFSPYIVSSHKKLSKLFREFKLKKVHIALVVDEYGRHLGVVTLEDILNALFQTQKKSEGTAK